MKRRLQLSYALLLLCFISMFCGDAAAQVTTIVNATGSPGSFNTGSVNAAGTKNDDLMIGITQTTNRGWAVFDLSGIPTGSTINSVNAIFTTTAASVNSTATNFVGGYVWTAADDPATVAGSSLFTLLNATAATAFNGSVWTPNALQTKALNAAGITFIANNLGGKVVMSYVRGSTNNYEIYGYGAPSAAQQPQLEITYIPSTACAGQPTAGTATGPAGACPGQNVNLNVSGYTAAANISFQWQYFDGSVWQNIAGATTSGYVVTGQAATTDYRVVVTCTNSGLSDNSNTVTVPMNSFLNCYCIPTYVNGGGADYIAIVQLGTLTNNTGALANPTPYYVNYTTQQPVPLAIPDLVQGTTENLSLTFGGDPNQYNGVWIDFDQNGVFDATEFMSSNTNTGANGTVIVPLSIPLTAIPGNTRMRIRGADDAQPTAGQACGASTSTYGEAEDYLVNIVATSACSGTPNSGTASAPASICPGSNVDLVLAGYTIATGIAIQWEYFDGSVWQQIPGGTTPNFSVIGQTSTTDYRAVVTCNGINPATSNTVTVNVVTAFPVPFNEGFNTSGTAVFPLCWSQQYVTGVSNITFQTNTANPATTPSEGTRYAFWNSYSITNLNSTRLVSPAISTLGLPSVDVTFDWMNNHNVNYSAGQYLAEGVQVQYSFDAVNWTDAGPFIMRHDPSLTAGTAQWNPKSVTLPGAAGNVAMVYVGLKFTSGFGDNCSVDDLSIVASPTCLAPSNLNTANLGATTVDLGWQENGSATLWQIEYGTTGFVPGTGTSQFVNTNPAPVSGLTPATGYDFYVRAICTPGDSSTWVGPFNFTTTATCAPVSGLAASNITTGSADISWTAVGGAAGYEYIIDQNAGAPVGPGTATTNTTFNAPGLTSSSVYYAHVRTDCGGNGFSVWTTISFQTLLGNDDAPGAILLTVGGGCSGNPFTNVGASQSVGEPFPSCEGATGFHAVWYKFDAPPSGAVKISNDYAGGTQGDSKIALFSAVDVNDYTTFTILACDDDNGVTLGTRSVTYATGLTPGTTYYIAVDGYGAGSTKGTFCVGVDELTSSMIMPTGSCSAGQASGPMNATYPGWVAIVETGATTRLIALVRQQPGGPGGTYGSSLTVNTAAVRSTAGQFYMDRNFLVTGPATGNYDLVLPFLDAEQTAFAAADPNGGTLANLNVTRQSGNTCQSTYDVANGTNTLLMQSGSTAYSGFGTVMVTTPGFSNFFIHAGNAPLFVELSQISAMNAGARNRIDWSTEKEEQGDNFVLERSADGRNFVAIGTIAGKSRASSYTYWDENPVSGLNHYRLKMMDATSAYAYSKVVTATVKDANAFSVEVLPNPVSNNEVLYVNVYGKMGTNPVITIADATGKIVRMISVSAGKTELNVSELAAGMYLVKYSDGSHSQIIKVNKQ